MSDYTKKILQKCCKVSRRLSFSQRKSFNYVIGRISKKSIENRRRNYFIKMKNETFTLIWKNPQSFRSNTTIIGGYNYTPMDTTQIYLLNHVLNISIQGSVSRTLIRLPTGLRRVFSMAITNICVAGKEMLCINNQS